MLTNCPTESTSQSSASSLFKKQQLIKDRGAPPIWIGLNELDNSYVPLCCVFCNYYCSNWYHKQRICNWFVKENKFGAATFWVTYFFRACILFLVLFSGTFWKKLVRLFCKSLLPFLTFVNCEGPYLAVGFLNNLCPCFDLLFAPLGVITRTNKKRYAL